MFEEKTFSQQNTGVTNNVNEGFFSIQLTRVWQSQDPETEVAISHFIMHTYDFTVACQNLYETGLQWERIDLFCKICALEWLSLISFSHFKT